MKTELPPEKVLEHFGATAIVRLKTEVVRRSFPMFGMDGPECYLEKNLEGWTTYSWDVDAEPVTSDKVTFYWMGTSGVINNILLPANGLERIREFEKKQTATA